MLLTDRRKMQIIRAGVSAIMAAKSNLDCDIEELAKHADSPEQLIEVLDGYLAKEAAECDQAYFEHNIAGPWVGEGTPPAHQPERRAWWLARIYGEGVVKDIRRWILHGDHEGLAEAIKKAVVWDADNAYLLLIGDDHPIERLRVAVSEATEEFFGLESGALSDLVT